MRIKIKKKDYFLNNYVRNYGPNNLKSVIPKPFSNVPPRGTNFKNLASTEFGYMYISGNSPLNPVFAKTIGSEYCDPSVELCTAKKLISFCEFLSPN